jgi:hypothetical protein
MIKFLTSAALVAVVTIASVPSQAEWLGGAPIRNGNKCWQSSPGHGRDGGFGYWADCPRAAAVNSGAELRHPLRPRRDQHNDR